MQLKRFFLLLLFTTHIPFLLAQSYDFDKKNGKVKTYHPNGQLASKGKVKQHLKTGAWNYWDADGYLIRTEYYKNNSSKCFSNSVLDGPYVTYHNNLQIDTAGNFSNGHKTGEWLVYDQYALRIGILHYDSLGNQVGVQKTWDSNHELIKYVFIAADTVEEDYTYDIFGKKQTALRKVNGKLDGVQSYYFANNESNNGDTLKRTEEYKNGKKNGILAVYSPKYGSKILEQHFENDTLQGKETRWNTAGELRSEGYYKNGKLDSVYRNYNYGHLTGENYYKNGKLSGKSTTYRSDGKEPESFSWWTKGKLDSSVTFYSNGKISNREYAQPAVYESRELMEQSEPPIKHTDFDTLGKKEHEYFILYPKKYGMETFFYPNGKILCTINYGNESDTGELKRFSPTGKLILQAKIAQNGWVSDPKVWDKNGKPIKNEGDDFVKTVNDNLPKGITYATENIDDRNGGQLPEPDFEMPQFPGGEDALRQFLHDNTKYPEMEKDANIQGRVYIQFTVEKDGSITNIKAVREVQGAPNFTREALRVVKMMPNWIPGKEGGKTVAVIFTLPFNFALN